MPFLVMEFVPGKSLHRSTHGRTIEFNQILGNKYLIVPGLPEQNRSSRAAWLETARLMVEPGRRLGQVPSPL